MFGPFGTRALKGVAVVSTVGEVGEYCVQVVLDGVVMYGYVMFEPVFVHVYGMKVGFQEAELLLGVCGRACDGGVVQMFFHEDAHVHVLGLISDEVLEESGFDLADFITFSYGDTQWIPFEADTFTANVEGGVCEFNRDVKVLSGDICMLCDMCDGELLGADDVAVVIIEFA